MDTRPRSLSRRDTLRGIGVVGAFGLAGCSGAGGQQTPTPRVERETVIRERTVVRDRELTEMHTLESEGTEAIPVWLYGLNNGVWENHGIDLSVEIAPYSKFSRQLQAELSNVGKTSVPQVPIMIEQGLDVTMLGTNQNFYNKMFARADSDIEGIEDLSDKRLAVPPTTTTTTNVVKAMVEDLTGFNIMDDTANTRTSSPPTLLPLLENGDVDAVLLFSGDTVSASVAEEFRTIFDPAELWEEETGYRPPVSNWGTVISWVEDNADLTRRFLDGWEDAVELFSENVTEAVTNYGRLGGVSTEAEADLIAEWLNQGIMFRPFEFTAGRAENQWELLEIIAELGTASITLPDKDAVFTTSAELEALIG